MNLNKANNAILVAKYSQVLTKLCTVILVVSECDNHRMTYAKNKNKCGPNPKHKNMFKVY